MTRKNNITEKNIKDYYERNPEGVPGTKEIPEIFEMHQIFKKQVKKLCPKKFLDTGCGKGYMGEAIRNLVKIYVGFDISKSALKIASGRIKKGAFNSGTIRKMPYKNSEFDVVLCSEVIEHIPKYEEAIKEIIRVCKIGGYILLSTPNKFNPDMIIQTQIKGKYTNQIYDKPINYKVINNIFEENGCLVLEFFSFWFHPPFGDHFPKPIWRIGSSIIKGLTKMTRMPLGLYLFYNVKKVKETKTK